MMRKAAWLACGFCFLAAVRAPSAPIIREPGAIYLSDFNEKPMKLKVLQPAPAYFDIAGKRYVGTLRVPQVVEVQAIADHAYRVRGNAQQGQILGWVEPKYLEPIPADTLAALKESEQRRIEVAALIAKKEIAMGMTTDEVLQSLGKPQKRTTRTVRDQPVQQVWEYVTYELIPQSTNLVGPNGAITVATTYVKTPVGRMKVTFTDDVVESIDESEGTISSGETTIVAPPVVVYW